MSACRLQTLFSFRNSHAALEQVILVRDSSENNQSTEENIRYGKHQNSFIKKLSSPINITTGILQGENLSPLLFNLFIGDIEKCFEESEIPGVNMFGKEIHLLMYADDKAVTAPNAFNMQRKIEKLIDYCDSLGLVINLQKTKIMEFRKSRRLSKNRFQFNGKEIES